MGLKPTAYIDHFGPDFTYSKQQIDKSLKMAYASPSKNAVERKKAMAIAKLSVLHRNTKNERKTKQNSSLKPNYSSFMICREEKV